MKQLVILEKDIPKYWSIEDNFLPGSRGDLDDLLKQCGFDLDAPIAFYPNKEGDYVFEQAET